MFTYKNQVEALLMQSDIEEGLGFKNIKFTGQHVLEFTSQDLFLEVEITHQRAYKAATHAGVVETITTHWVAMKDAELIFADEQPKGVQLPNLVV